MVENKRYTLSENIIYDNIEGELTQDTVVKVLNEVTILKEHYIYGKCMIL